jgi:hypothetical protein
MSSLQAFNLRPLWRLISPRNQQKVACGGIVPRRDVKNEDCSGDVYENKWDADKMASKKSDIYGKVRQFRRILPI